MGQGFFFFLFSFLSSLSFTVLPQSVDFFLEKHSVILLLLHSVTLFRPQIRHMSDLLILSSISFNLLQYFHLCISMLYFVYFSNLFLNILLLFPFYIVSLINQIYNFHSCILLFVGVLLWYFSNLNYLF